MKQLKTFIILLLITFSFTIITTAHGGKTDSAGGHYNRSNGEYHYHHGYPAHQHTDGECPYDFKNNESPNKNNRNNSNSSNSKKQNTTNTAETTTQKTNKKNNSVDIEMLLIILGVFLIPVITIGIMCFFARIMS